MAPVRRDGVIAIDVELRVGVDRYQYDDAVGVDLIPITKSHFDVVKNHRLVEIGQQSQSFSPSFLK